MGKITGGEVVYERRIKTGEFEHKHVNVKIAFSVDEDDTSFAITLDRAGRAAVEKAHEMLGLSVVGVAGGKPIQAQTRRNTATGPENFGSSPATAALEELAAKAKQDQADLAAAEAKARAATAAQAQTDPLGDILGGDKKSEPPKPITPQELIERIQHVNKTVKDVTPKIRELVSRYLGGKPGSAMTIPEEKRAAFLVELEALKGKS